MNSDANDPTGRRTSEDPANSGVTGSAIDPKDALENNPEDDELEDDEFGHVASTAGGGLVPEGADDDHP